MKSTKNHKIRNFRCPVPSHFGQSGTLHFDGWGLAFVVGLAFPPLSSLYGVYWCLPLQQSRTNCPHEPHFQHGGYGGGIGWVCCCGGTCIWALRRFSSPPGRVWASTVASVPTPLAPLHVPLGPSLLSHPRASVHTFFCLCPPHPLGDGVSILIAILLKLAIQTYKLQITYKILQIIIIANYHKYYKLYKHTKYILAMQTLFFL